VRIPHATRTPDPGSLIVSPEHMMVDSPAAAWNGSSLLVVWNENIVPPGSPPIYYPLRTVAARVTGSLALLDPAPLVVAETEENHWDRILGAPSVASNGDDWLVVVDIGARDILARRVRSDGAAEGNGPERIAAGGAPVAAWDGTSYSVAWKDASNVRLAAVPAEGAPVAARQTLVATHAAPSALSIAPARNQEVAVIYTKVSYRPEHTGVERTFLRFMDFTTLRGRVVRR
jgi:hypothetical protein